MNNSFFIFVVLFITLGCVKEQDSSLSSRNVEALHGEEYFELMNDHREKLGLTRLSYLGVIQESAFEHSSAMAKGTRPFGHTGLSLRCSKLQTELRSTSCGEIVATGQVSAKDVLKAWLNSSSHRASIEKAEWTDTGVALSISQDGTFFWTQIFLRLD
jgi:uncharacterized protein YkwD